MRKIFILVFLLFGCSTVAPISTGFSIADIPKMLTYEQMQENAIINKKLRKMMEFKVSLTSPDVSKDERKVLHLRIAPDGLILYITGGQMSWWQ